MKFRSKALSIGAVVVVLFVIGFTQLEAQSTITLQSLSQRLDRAIVYLNNVERVYDRNRVEVAARLERIERRLGITPIPPTKTRIAPTSTPTRIRLTPTSTSTPAPTVPYVTITRPMNLRSGPGTNYPIIQVAEVGDIFDITGRDAQGTWWRIDVEGENAWVYAAYVTATNADRIRSVPTPLPPRPTPQRTATPRPQTSQSSSGEGAYAYAAALVFFDQMSMGTLDEWTNSPDSQKNRAVQISASLLTQLTRWCGLSTEEMADLVGEYGKVLDNTGYTARTGLPVRQLLMYFMTEFAEENPNRTASCEELFEVGAMSLLESE